MLKSINDIDAQAERIIQMAEGTRFFNAAKFNVDRSTIYQLARAAKSQHGFSIFETDKDTKRECIHPYHNRMHTLIPWWDTPEHKYNMQRIREKTQREASEREAKRKAAKQYTRQEIEVRMQKITDAQMMCKVLAWIGESMMVHSQLGLPGDPYEVPRRLVSECMQYIPHEGKQLTLF